MATDRTIELARRLQMRGQLVEAERLYRDLLGDQPDALPALEGLGVVLYQQGRAEDAAAVFARGVALDPQSVRFHGNLGESLRAVRRLDQAHQHLRTAVALDPRNVLAWNSLGLVSFDLRRYDAALHAYRSAIQLDPRFVRAWVNLADTLRALGRSGEAVDALREALRLDSTMADAWLALATIHAERGQIELSCQSARTALALRPDLAEAYWRLANNLLGQLPESDLQAMEALALDESLSNDDRALLHFGLAMAQDRRGLYERAVASLETANAQQSTGKFTRGIAYNPDQHSEFIDRIISIVTPEFLARGSGWGEPDTRPVFVVGFPRSGTTLTEQVLASHPQVKGAGELLDLSLIFQSLPQIVGVRVRDSLEALKLLGPASAKTAARRYLDKLDSLAPAGIVRIVDKDPENLNHLGLIALLFSDARVIICRRDPRDIALSCWQTGFRSCSWNNDWNHISQRLAGYQRIVAHWERVRPVAFLEVEYEAMVVDLEHQARRLIEFVGLDWDPSCLEFHANPREVRTPSLAQVRQPIHSRSAGRWRSYEPFVPDLFKAFERYGVEVNHNAR